MPELIAAELDTERFEVRKVEVFRDGRIQGVDRLHEAVAETMLATEPWPTLEAIIEDPGESFTAQPMSAAVFENLWHQSQKTLATSIPVEPQRSNQNA